MNRSDAMHDDTWEGADARMRYHDAYCVPGTTIGEVGEHHISCVYHWEWHWPRPWA